MERLTVKQLAQTAGVSVRTLHHYDKIGLLKPGIRAESRYRYYGNQEALRLQQILLYREMGLELSAIREILDDPDFNVVEALKSHRVALQEQRKRLQTLLRTIDTTILSLEQKRETMDYRELYKGFTAEEAEAYRKEAQERWGKEVIEESHNRLLRLSKNEWEELMAFGEQLNEQLAAQVGVSDPASAEVQQLISLHFDFIGKHFDVTREIYRSLGEMYAEDERFHAYYDKYHPKLAEFLRDAIQAFCA